MKTPVLIPAYNAERHIQRTLGGISEELEPIVLANGCEDSTAELAREMGATVVEIEEAGKMPALQTGVRLLGERALEPILAIDADSRPDFPRNFAQGMKKALTHPEVGVVTGPYRYVNRKGHPTNTIRAGKAYTRNMFANHSGKNYACGRNMGFYFRTTETRDAFLELPNYWPGEDKAIADTIVDMGGKHVYCLDPRTVVSTSDETQIPLLQRVCLQFSPEQRHKILLERYVSRGPADSRPYLGRESRAAQSSQVFAK